MVTLEDLFQDRVLVSFDQLRKERVLPASHFLAYGWLIAEIRRLWHITDLEPDLHLLIQTMHTMGEGLQLITWLTWALLQLLQDPWETLRRGCMGDMGRELKQKEWDRALLHPWNVSCNV